MQNVQAIGKIELKGPRACHKTERETPIESAQGRRPQTPPPEEEGILRAGVGRNEQNYK